MHARRAHAPARERPRPAGPATAARPLGRPPNHALDVWSAVEARARACLLSAWSRVVFASGVDCERMSKSRRPAARAEQRCTAILLRLRPALLWCRCPVFVHGGWHICAAECPLADPFVCSGPTHRCSLLWPSCQARLPPASAHHLEHCPAYAHQAWARAVRNLEPAHAAGWILQASVAVQWSPRF